MLIAPLPAESAIDLSIVLPTFNEAQSIAAVVEQLSAVLDPIRDLKYEIIVVDDDSPDQTWDCALQLAEISRSCA